MNKIIKAIIRQYDIGQWWGGFSNAFSNIAIFITLFNTVLLIPIAYVTWFTPWVSNLGLVIPFTVFISVIFVAGIVVLLIGYKVLIPSTFVFWNEQWWFHGNLLRGRLDIRDKEINEQYKRLYKQIDSIKAELKELRVALLKKNRNE